MKKWLCAPLLAFLLVVACSGAPACPVYTYGDTCSHMTDLMKEKCPMMPAIGCDKYLPKQCKEFICTGDVANCRDKIRSSPDCAFAISNLYACKWSCP